MEETGGVEEKVPTKEAMAEFCLVFAEAALQVVNTKARKKVENIIRLIYDGNFDADELCWHVSRIDDCKRLLEHSRDKELAEDCFTKMVAKRGKRNICVWTSAVQRQRCSGFTETDCDEIVARHVFQLARCFRREGASCWYAARSESAEEGARDGGHVEKQQYVVEK